MRVFLIISAALLLSGCWPSVIFPAEVINPKLDALKGRSVSEVIAKFGAPDSEKKLANKKVYDWRWETTKKWPEGSERYYCKIIVFTDYANKITGHDGEGQSYACAHFAKKLDPSYDFNP